MHAVCSIWHGRGEGEGGSTDAAKCVCVCVLIPHACGKLAGFEQGEL